MPADKFWVDDQMEMCNLPEWYILYWTFVFERGKLHSENNEMIEQ